MNNFSIKSGGGNGPMKPGNLYIKVLNPTAISWKIEVKY